MMLNRPLKITNLAKKSIESYVPIMSEIEGPIE